MSNRSKLRTPWIRIQTTTLLFLTTVQFVAAQETIVLSGISVYPDDRATRQVVHQAIALADRYLEREYPEIDLDVALLEDGKQTRTLDGVSSLLINAVSTPDGDVITLSLSGDTWEESAMPITQKWGENLYRSVAGQIAFLHAARGGFALIDPLATPLFVAELEVSELVGSTVNVPGVQLYPQALAVLPEGDVIAACITTSVRLGPDFSVRSVPGLSLLEEGNYSSAMNAAATPAGKIITRPTMGRDIFVYNVGEDRPVRIRSPLTGSGPIAALSDGSIVVTDLATRNAAVLRDGRSDPIDIYAQEYSFVPAISAGPEGNLWVFDTMERKVLVFTPDGNLIDTILPLAPVDMVAGTRSLGVAENGDFLLLSMDALWKFDRRGRPVWSLESLGQMAGVAYDGQRGAVYLADYMGQRLIKLVEPNHPNVSEFDRTMLQFEQERETGDGGVELDTKIALFYEERGAHEMAQSTWRKVLDQDRFNSQASLHIDQLEEQLLIAEAERISRSVFRTLEQLGPESARRDFGRAIQLYEEILFLNPDSERSRSGKALLESAFDRGLQPSNRDPDVQVVALDLNEIFPSQTHAYRNGGAGTISVRNSGDSPIEDISVSYRLPAFMTGPETRAFSAIAPREEGEFQLAAVFDQRILELNEDLAAQVEVRLDFTRDGQAREIVSYNTTTIHRRTALIWDRTEKLASFITPNEEVAAGFALRILASEWDGGDYRFSRKMQRAVHLAVGLGEYHIAYVEDPFSPISNVLGSPTAVDTVRLPRTTLYYRSGDCDDTSALLASLYEASGIETAILTTPGHVFIAFNTEEPISSRWMFESDQTKTIEFNGSVWIPVETTVLGEGFQSSWRAASELVERYANSDDFDFVSVRAVRDEFPPLSLSQATISIAEPLPEYLLPRVTDSWNETMELLYSNGKAALEETLVAQTGPRKAALLNRLGVLHARFGALDAAESALHDALELRPTYVSAYVNLANVATIRGDNESAIAFLEQAEGVAPESPAVVENLARLHFAAGNAAGTRRYFDRLSAIDPARASGISALIAADSAARASKPGDIAGSLPPVIWPAGEE